MEKNKDKIEEKELAFFQYSLVTILYANDCAMNMALNVCNAFKYTKYKSKIYSTLCSHIKKEADAYFKIFNDVFKDNIDFISNFNVVCDERCDKITNNITDKIKNSLIDAGVENAEFIAMLETCRCLMGYSCNINDTITEKASRMYKTVEKLEQWKPQRAKNLIDSLSDYVFYVIPKGVNLNLNEIDGLVGLLNDWSKNIFDYKQYKKNIETI